MCCLQVLFVTLLVCQTVCASLNASHTSTPALHTSTPASHSTLDPQDLLETRFPPRVYSFDPRPKIDHADLIFNQDFSRGKNEAARSESADEISAAPLSVNTSAPLSVNTSDSVSPQENLKRREENANFSSVSDGGEVFTNRTPTESSYNIVADLPEDAGPLAEAEDEERPRAIVDVRREGLSGEVSYIIHPDNQPAPTYMPMQDLPPPSRPVAQWRPDIFMKVCCSDPNSAPQPTKPVAAALLQIKSDYSQVDTSVPGESEPMEATSEMEHETKENDGEIVHEGDSGDADTAEEITTIVPEAGDDASTQRSSRNSTEIVTVTNITDITNHQNTPRYEEAGSTTYQDVTNFLKDIANSDGFKNAFLGDLINNFGNLDQNAMKLIYSLLIRPLEGVQVSNKEDRMGTVAELRQGRPHRPVIPHERLPLHDRPSDSYQLFGPIFPPSRSSGSKRPSIRPSYPVRQAPAAAASDDAWHPSRTAARLSAHGRRGDEGIDVITAPPFQTFEVVLGSSINHDDKKRERSSIQVPPVPHNGPPIPFSKLTLGLEMPPPDALDALPPGSVLIPPSHIIGRPKLPIIHNKRNGTPGIEMPLAEFLPNLPFFSNKSPRFRPPAKPQAQDIPPRLPSFLSSLLPNAPSPRPVRPPGPVMSPPRSSGSLGGSSAFLDVNRPTGPPPPVSKLMPPGQWVSPSVPTVPVPQWPFEQDSASTSIARPGIVLSDVPTTVFGSFPHPSHHATDNVPPLHVSVSPSLKGATILKKQENPASYQPPLVDVQSEKEAESSGGAGNQPVDYTPNRSEGHNSESSGFIPGITHDQQRPSDSAYDPDLSPEYVNYYDVDYRDYYHIQTEGSSGSGQIDSGAKKQTHHHNSAASMDVVDLPIIITPTTTSPRLNSHLQEGHKGGDPMLDHLPSIVDLDGRHTSLDDLLGVRKPEVPPLTLTEQEKNDLQMLLQNHRMAYALAEGNGTVAKLSSIQGDSSVVDDLPAASVDEASSAPASFQGELATSDNGHYQVPLTGYRRGSQASLLPVEHDAHTVFGEHGVDAVLGGQDVDTVFGEHDPSVAHLWKNIQLIPLAPDIFEHATQDYDDTMNLTSLFDGAVPLSPGSNQDLEPDGHDLDGVASDTSGGHVTMSEEVMEDTDKANAKFMAYVLIGACCGLALLSIAGVIVIVRFKKTCGSRQIKTRSRLTEQDSIESISRRVENLTLGGESGHKLGSWFTGRNEQFGAGKLRSNMALPEVQDLKREKSSKSGSTRDLLSISSESSRSNSPGEVQRGEESGRTDDEEPRSSWLHDEYRASGSEASQEEQDQAYSPQQYQQSRSSPDTVTPKSHPADHHSVRPESSVEVDHMERSVRERRYTGQPRSDDDQLQRSASRRGPRYISSMDSDELEERLVTRDPHYTTDSELDDGTTHYDDDDESREPSRYFSDSRELDDVVASRRMDLAIMTSQELGEHLSRDLKQYQSRRTSKVQQQQEDNRDTSRLHESSQEVEGEDGSRELQRSQSQVSFSRDNVQNEVFLEFDNIFRQHGQYLNSEPAASTLGRVSRGTDDTHVSVSRANTPDSIDLPTEFLQDLRDHDDRERLPSSAPTTPPRFSPPTAPPRPPKPGHLSQPGTPSPQAGRARSPSPGQTSPSARNKQRPVYWTNEEERLI